MYLKFIGYTFKSRHSSAKTAKHILNPFLQYHPSADISWPGKPLPLALLTTLPWPFRLSPLLVPRVCPFLNVIQDIKAPTQKGSSRANDAIDSSWSKYSILMISLEQMLLAPSLFSGLRSASLFGLAKPAVALLGMEDCSANQRDCAASHPSYGVLRMAMKRWQGRSGK